MSAIVKSRDYEGGPRTLEAVPDIIGFEAPRGARGPRRAWPPHPLKKTPLMADRAPHKG